MTTTDCRVWTVKNIAEGKPRMTAHGAVFEPVVCEIEPVKGHSWPEPGERLMPVADHELQVESLRKLNDDAWKRIEHYKAEMSPVEICSFCGERTSVGHIHDGETRELIPVVLDGGEDPPRPPRDPGITRGGRPVDP